MMDFEPYLDDSDPPKIPLPEGWPDFAVAAVLHIIAVARLAIMLARIWSGGGECSELRFRTEIDRLRSEVELLKREIEIKDSRFATIDSRRRPRYSSRQRLAILVLSRPVVGIRLRLPSGFEFGAIQKFSYLCFL